MSSFIIVGLLERRWTYESVTCFITARAVGIEVRVILGYIPVCAGLAFVGDIDKVPLQRDVNSR